eukprot:TRINITY_DN18717_c0_g1_i1.p1 TRINITY_DN18717_c0_g1~~TRINITY_DN18717_c0_g1_i1.p1  ORF type:complete len:171 (+),score=16.89 TRINITY_DN18717_c0_g1_i1:2-514(+)
MAKCTCSTSCYRARKKSNTTTEFVNTFIEQNNLKQFVDGERLRSASVDTKLVPLSDQQENVIQLVNSGDLHHLKKLMGGKQGKDLVDSKDYEGRSILHIACELGNIQITKHVLRKRWYNNINLKDSRGMTPLHCASSQGHLEICLLLLQFLADTKRSITSFKSFAYFFAK